MNPNEVVIHETELDLNIEVNSDAIPGTRTVGFGGKSKAEREADMRQFFASNPTIYKLGHLLSLEVQGQSLAAWLITGKSVPVPQVKLANGQKIAPKNVQSMTLTDASVGQWGCLNCKSAHGTGVGPSQHPKLDALKSNIFYYGAETSTLFTISRDCFDNYVKATGLASQIKANAAPAPRQEKGGKK